jgi:hypothetical protein
MSVTNNKLMVTDVSKLMVTDVSIARLDGTY